MLFGLLLARLSRFVRNADVRTQHLRWHAYPLAGRLVPPVGVEHEGVRLVLSTHDSDGVGRSTFSGGAFEKETLERMLASLERPGGSTLRGMTVLEVGSNIGTETVSLLTHHGVERVFAFEPDAENAQFLRANLALNGLQDRADVHEMALSDVDATLLLERSLDNCGDHRIRVGEVHGPDLYNEGDRSTVEVRAARIDTLAQEGELDLDAVGLVWMDAQGHEGQVLAGAHELIARGIPVLTEYWPYGLDRAGGVDRFHSMVADGYSTVIDLRSGSDEPPCALPAEQVAQLADRYAGDTFSNILLLAG